MRAERSGAARRWLEIARADYVSAAESSDPYTICFHAQQWVEKAAKAVLALHRAKVPHNHDMAALLTECERLAPALGGIKRHAALLQPFAVAIRYDHVKTQAVNQCAVVWAAAMEICGAIDKVINGTNRGHDEPTGPGSAKRDTPIGR